MHNWILPIKDYGSISLDCIEIHKTMKKIIVSSKVSILDWSQITNYYVINELVCCHDNLSSVGLRDFSRCMIVRKMAWMSMKAKRTFLKQRKSHIYKFVFRSQLSTAVRFSLLNRGQRISKLVAEKYGRKRRRVSRERSTEWCEKDMREMSDMEFRNNFRLSRAAFQKLQERIDPEVRREETFPATQFRWSADWPWRYTFLDRERTIVPWQMNSKLASQQFANLSRRQPGPSPTSDAELHAAMQTFNFPNCVGAIDGTHIKIKRPVYGTDFNNRKGYYSILLQGICDGNGKFTSISCGHPGSIHDARMLKRSGFYGCVLAEVCFENMFSFFFLLIIDR